MKIGDKVRFLSEVGGGVVTGFQGKNFVLETSYFSHKMIGYLQICFY